MITKEFLKKEIDKIQDEYLYVLYKIIKTFEYTPEAKSLLSDNFSVGDKKDNIEEWLAFVNETYGCLADDPIERGEQGAYEVRETL